MSQQRANGTSSSSMPTNGKKYTVLVLGSGLVSPPLVHYLTDHHIHTIIASRTVPKAQNTISKLRNPSYAEAIECDVERDNGAAIQTLLPPLVERSDLVVSLLPFIYHVAAAKIALRFNKHFCTTSYIAPAMQELDTEFKSKNLMCLNECGLDPGLDHMSAQRVIDQVHQRGGQVRYFTSVCGVLPSHKANTNPLGYKLSWAPRGVLLASRNPAIVQKDGKTVEYGPGKIYDEGVYIPHDIVDGHEYEWYYNRDSAAYLPIYGIPEALTCIRGTYRYKGWCRFLRSISQIGLTSTDPLDSKYKGLPYNQWLAAYVGGAEPSAEKGNDVKSIVAKAIGIDVNDDIIQRMEFMGLFSSEFQVNAPTPLDAVCYHFERTCQYQAGEQDMVVMKHTFEAVYPNDPAQSNSVEKRETITSTLIDLGHQDRGGFSTTARTVSLPLGVAIRAVLEQRIPLSEVVGVIRPIKPILYNTILDEMETLGVKFTDRVLPQLIWLRHEVKEGEERVAIVPKDVSKLIEAGYRVCVEGSNTRAIPDSEYEKVSGVAMVPSESWMSAPISAYIIGLKELPEENFPLIHRHIQFAHCYKRQGGWENVLSRFPGGGGILYDIEFLTDDSGRRIAAFGRAAGLVGMALALKQWSLQRLHQNLNDTAPLKSWRTLNDAVEAVKQLLQQATSIGNAADKHTSTQPRAMVLGALGRCGQGAVWFAEQCGVETIQWDIPETKKGGPFDEIVRDYDVLVNAIYLSHQIPPFIDHETIRRVANQRKLTVISDVSCDTSNPFNPLPIYNQLTTLKKPILNIIPGDATTSDNKPLDMMAIDHLPSLIPLDASQQFSNDLIPHLVSLNSEPPSSVWARAEKLYYEKIQTLPKEYLKSSIMPTVPAVSR